MYTVNDLHTINDTLLPLKTLAERELDSIYGLSGLVYTPHIDHYMKICIKKAEIVLALKTQGILPFSSVEIISDKLMLLHRRIKNLGTVEYDGNTYECRYAPLKLSKTGKVVRKWAKYWLKKSPDGEIDPQWENEVKELWPAYFVIRDFAL